MKQSTQRVKPDTREIITLALFAALMIISKEALAALPNIEVVTVLIITLTHNIGIKVLWSVYTFVIVQVLIYPSGTWIIAYLYVWALLVFIVLTVRKYGGAILYTVIAAIYGIIFGVLCSIPSFFIGGFGYGISEIISGLSFDVTHCIGNAVTTALLFHPLNKAFSAILK